jgi:hypothetical protein
MEFLFPNIAVDIERAVSMDDGPQRRPIST